MDFLTLAMSVIHALAPLGPALLGMGGAIGAGIVTKIGENIGDDAYNQVKGEGKRLYQIVEGRFDRERSIDSGSASRALQNFMYEPDTYQDIFQKKLAALLDADPSFADRVSETLNSSPALQQIIRGGNQTILRNNEQTNTLGHGEQRLEVGDGGTAEGNRQTIKYEKS
jgi:hypothetical protein